MNTFKYILSIGLAASAGVALGILTAPRSGKRTRERLMDDLDDTKSAISRSANKKLKEAKKALNETVEKQVAQGKELLNKTTKEFAK